MEKNKCITAIDEKRRVKNIKEINKRGGWIFFSKTISVTSRLLEI